MRFFVLLVLTFSSLPAFSGFESSINFSENEKAIHRNDIAKIMKAGADCLKKDLDHHNSFYKKYGISPFYGDRSSFSKLSDSKKRAFLKRLGLSGDLVNKLEPTSCVGLAVKCLEKGFFAANEKQIWRKLKDFTQANDFDGTALQHGLRELGWKVLYWNPDTAQNERWDEDEANEDPDNNKHFWGYHAYRWSTIHRSSKYMYNTVDDYSSLVNFETNPPEALQNIPFFIGTAHTGYHVFPGTYGRVIEGHSTRSITDSHTMESSMFNPLEDGGGPRGNYKTGLIAVPPNYGY